MVPRLVVVISTIDIHQCMAISDTIDTTINIHSMDQVAEAVLAWLVDTVIEEVEAEAVEEREAEAVVHHHRVQAIAIETIAEEEGEET